MKFDFTVKSGLSRGMFTIESIESILYLFCNFHASLESLCVILCVIFTAYFGGLWDPTLS